MPRRQWKEVVAGQEDFLCRLIREVVQQLLEAEMGKALGAEKGERMPKRQDADNSCRQVGTASPQDPQGWFRTENFERYQRSEKALVGALTEMYIQGVSTRKVKAVTEELCGHEFAASTVSRMNQSLDKQLEKSACRRLDDAYPYVILDARYEKIRKQRMICSAGRHRYRLGGSLVRARGRVNQLGIHQQLERVRDGGEAARTECRRPRRQR